MSFQLAADWAPLTGLVSSLVQAHISCSAGAVRINRVVMSCMRSAVGSAMIAVSVSKSPVAGVERAPQALVSLHKTFTVCANMVPAQQGFTQKTSSWTKDVHPVEPFPLKGFVSHLLMLHLPVTGHWYSFCSDSLIRQPSDLFLNKCQACSVCSAERTLLFSIPVWDHHPNCTVAMARYGQTLLRTLTLQYCDRMGCSVGMR